MATQERQGVLKNHCLICPPPPLLLPMKIILQCVTMLVVFVSTSLQPWDEGD